MLLGNWQERTAAAVPLPGKRAADVIELFAVLHPPNKDLSEETARSLLPLCDEYQITLLMDKIDRFLEASHEGSTMERHALAVRYGLHRLRHKCVRKVES